MAGVSVAGYCPMGCGQTLFVGGAGCVTCSYIGCPRPSAVDELLADGETEHIVTIREDGFTVQHPLRERLDDDLHECELHQELQAGGCMPAWELGRYRVHVLDDGRRWDLEPLREGKAAR